MILLINVIVLLAPIVITRRRWKTTPQHRRSGYIIGMTVATAWIAGVMAILAWGETTHISNDVFLRMVSPFVLGVPIGGCIWARIHEKKHKQLTEQGEAQTRAFPVIQNPCNAVPRRVLPVASVRPRGATPPQVKYDERLENWAYAQLVR